MRKLILSLTLVALISGVFFLSDAFATSSSLSVQTCANRGGTVSIGNCSGLNAFNSAQDVNVSKNGILGTGMSDVNAVGTISGLTARVYHSGQAGITGTGGVTFWDAVNGVAFCSESDFNNTTSFVLSSIASCTPAGGWDNTKVNNLEIRVKNKDLGTSQKMYLSYIAVTVNYSAYCGNAIIESPEICDSNALGGLTCTDMNMGFTGGTLGCSSSCDSFDTSLCT